MKIKLPFSFYTKKKSVLAFEFGIVLYDVAKELNIPMTQALVLRAEDLLTKELGQNSAEHFACNMNVYAMAVLEPKD